MVLFLKVSKIICFNDTNIGLMIRIRVDI